MNDIVWYEPSGDNNSSEATRIIKPKDSRLKELNTYIDIKEIDNIYFDERGYNLILWPNHFINELVPLNFFNKQIMISKSNVYVLRGLHAQEQLNKAITVLSGTVMDVGVISEGEYKGYYYKLLLRPGLAIVISNYILHGFKSLHENTTVLYAYDRKYNIKEEYGYNAFSPELGIEWGFSNSLSDRDKKLPNFEI